MATATISFPLHMDLATILAFARELDSYAMHEKLIIAFSKEDSFFSPFAMLFIGAKLKSLLLANNELKIEFKDFKHHDYLAHMGFFHLCGTPHGREIGANAGGENYVPITCLDRESFYEQPGDKSTSFPI